MKRAQLQRKSATTRGLLVALAALSLPGMSLAQGIRATVDDVPVNFADVQPMMNIGRVMVPVRGVFEHLNASVVWDETTHEVIAQHGTDRIRMPINSYKVKVNDRTITLDAPAKIMNGRTMVPLRFLSETLGASVEWIADTRTVAINTLKANEGTPDFSNPNVVSLFAGTVIPFTLEQPLSSNESKQGDRFRATLVTDDKPTYEGLPAGTVLEGYVEMARPKNGNTPGVLGLAFDRVRLPDGKAYRINGTLIGLDKDSIEEVDGRWVAKADARKDNLKYVGYGAGAGALVAIATKGNLINNTLIGGALGYLLGELRKDPSKARDVTTERGDQIGVRLTKDLSFRTPLR